MGYIGINVKRMIITLILGLLAGIICAGGTVMGNNPNFQITIAYIIYLVYNRIILGFIIGLVENLKIIKHENGNSVVRGAVLGAIVSIILVIIPGLVAISFIIAGIVFGIIIDLIATMLCPTES